MGGFLTGYPRDGPEYDPPLFNHDIEEAVATSLREAAERQDPRIAVIGERGVGKSSLINSLRGIRPGELGSAKVGADEVVTDEQLGGGAFYRDAGLIYQDVPGCRGNQMEMSMGAEYIERFQLNKADCCLFVYVAVLNVDTIKCANLLRAQGISVCFVRNKVDVDSANEIEDGNATSEDAALFAIRNRAKEQMHAKDAGEYAHDDRLFLLSAKYSHAVQHSPPKYDFEKLRICLQHAIKDETKRAQVKEIFGKNAKALAACRAQECRKQVSSYVIASAASGAIPVPGVSQVGDIAILGKACEEFQRIFCLTEAQLPPGDMAGFGAYLALKVGTSIPFIFGVSQLANWAADGAAWVPILGIPFSIVFGASVSALGMYLTLTVVIGRLEEIAAATYEIVMNLRHDNVDESRQELEELVDRLFPPEESDETLAPYVERSAPSHRAPLPEHDCETREHDDDGTTTRT